MKNDGAYPRTCGRCDKVLTDDEFEKSTKAGKESGLGRHYCSDHLQPALDGKYNLRIKP